MKGILVLFLVLPLIGLTQQINVNTFDKFLKQQRIETAPIPIAASTKAKVNLTYKSIGYNSFIVLSGYGWGVTSINENDEAIFLFDNDSTVKVKSIGLQSYDINNATINYSHHYHISKEALDMLSQHTLLAIRKYALQDFAEIQIEPKFAANVKALSSLFLKEMNASKKL